MNLLAERINRGLSRADLANRTGLSIETLRLVEVERHRPRPATAKAIADFYGVKVTDIWPVEPLEPAA